MHTKPQIKICGIKDVKTARLAVALGSHYIGLVFHPSSKRYVTPEKAKKISETVRNAGGLSVGVFVDQSQGEIISICEQAKIGMVQLHGENARKAHLYLPAHIVRVFVLHVSAEGEIMNKNDLDFFSLNPSRDYLLFDNPLGCNGREINLDHIDFSSFKFKYFIAGGLSHHNVRKFVDLFSPFGIDVCSRVEKKCGKKDLNLIKEFVKGAVNEH